MESGVKSVDETACLSFFSFVGRTFTCGACGELFCEPVTLPCGACICSPCFFAILPQPEVYCEVQTHRNPSIHESYGSRYKCPASDCSKYHWYRHETPSVMVSQLMRKCLPSVCESYEFLKCAMLELKQIGVGTWKEFEDSPDFSFSVRKQHDQKLRWIITEYIDPAINLAPILQRPYLFRSRVYFELGFFIEAFADARIAMQLNFKNGFGQIAERCVIKAESLSSDLNIYTIQQTQFLVDAINNFISYNSSKCRRITQGDLECSLCMNIMCEPITSPCGHTLCRPCILRLVQLHSSELTTCCKKPQCPLCRGPLPCYRFLKYRPSDQVIMAFINSYFAEEYQNRWTSFLREPSMFCIRIPILVCTSLVFPEIPCFLQFTRPQSQKLLRDCMNRNIPFGMCLPKSSIENFEISSLLFNQSASEKSCSCFSKQVCTCKSTSLSLFQTLYSSYPQQQQQPHLPKQITAPLNASPYVDYGTVINIESYESIFDNEEPTEDDDDCERLPRYLVKSTGGFRFRVLQREHDENGNDCAYIERIEDQLSDDEDDSDEECEESTCESSDENLSSFVDENSENDQLCWDYDGDIDMDAEKKIRRCSQASQWSEPLDSKSLRSLRSDASDPFFCPVEGFFSLHARIGKCVSELRTCMGKSCEKQKSHWFALCDKNKDHSDFGEKRKSSCGSSVVRVKLCNKQKMEERMNKARSFVEDFVKKLPEEEQIRFKKLHGDCPDSAAFAFWLAHMLPEVTDAEKYGLLCMTNGKKRLK
ncbi:LON peptidase N-terminal domain and RING finger protein 1, partial [Nowakowskiella sp. JEL0078]